jgi:AcrR family transcriptional regulator
MKSSVPAAQTQTSSRQQQREKTRKRILCAAIDNFAEAGFEASSLSNIAKQAGVKKALVQYHFSTKEQLWQESATRIWTERNQELAAFIADTGSNRNSTDPQSRMRNAFVAVANFTRERPQWLWFMFHEGAVNGDRLQWLIDNFIGEDYAQGQAFIRDYQSRGLIRPGSPLQMINLISGALTFNLLVAPQTYRATHQDMTSEEAILEQVELLLEMLTP